MPYSEIDKLQYEVEKLMLDVKSLKRPFFLQPTSWITMVGLFLSIGVNISQSYNGAKEKLLADIHVAQANLEVKELEKAKDSIGRETQNLNEKITAGTKQFEDLQSQIVQAQEILKKVQKDSANNPGSTQQIYNSLRKSLETISTSNQQAARNFQSGSVFAKSATQNLQLARQKETDGFESLINGDYPNAVASFRASENAYNGYHRVYELAKLIDARKADMAGDQAKRNEVIRTILAQYAYGAPQDMIKRLQEIVKN